MVGPACAMGETYNNCPLTDASNTQGHIAVAGTTSTPSGRCGTSEGNAATECGDYCTEDSQCSSGKTCHIGVYACVTNTIGNRCGTTWTDANNECGTACTTDDTPCPSGETCFADITIACSGDVPEVVTTTPPENPAIDVEGECISQQYVVKENRPPEVTDGYCHTSCVTLTNECDPDLCVCVDGCPNGSWGPQAQSVVDVAFCDTACTLASKKSQCEAHCRCIVEDSAVSISLFALFLTTLVALF